MSGSEILHRGHVLYTALALSVHVSVVAVGVGT